MTLATAVERRGAGFRRGAGQSDGRMPLRTAAGLGLGAAVLWLSLLVLLPLAAVVVKATGNGWSGFWDALTTREALSALRLTVFSSIGVAALNAIIGTLIAWVLVRDSFRGKRVVEVVIDIPFALPTIVAGLVLLTLYGPHSPVGVNWYATTRGGGQSGREPVYDLSADHPARDLAGDSWRRRIGFRPGDGRIRLGSAYLGRTAVQDRDLVDVRVQPDRER